MNNLTSYELNVIIWLTNIITQSLEKLIISIVLSKNLKNLSISIHYLLFFSRDKYERKLTVEEADSKQIKLAKEQKGMGRIAKTVEQENF